MANEPPREGIISPAVQALNRLRRREELRRPVTLHHGHTRHARRTPPRRYKLSFTIEDKVNHVFHRRAQRRL